MLAVWSPLCGSLSIISQCIMAGDMSRQTHCKPHITAKKSSRRVISKHVLPDGCLAGLQ
ncbi:hypothetical protein DPMN_009352 [Dreissena polymorpha]|uniref:Uncharacterized protein n=1 Tax=Dreissena polymorpha TaxID=45954 RepID=A0A9D4RY48_DREPO|nr:hypothetical protein DPMN_009352 [Dreissena polymorpha]